MSKVRLIGSTSGYTELQASAVAGANTMTLPAATGIVDHLSRAGNILQVVQATTNTEVIIATATYTDSGLTATITPTSATSKVLVMVSQQVEVNKNPSSSAFAGLRLMRGATAIVNPIQATGGTPYEFGINQPNNTASTAFYHRFALTYLDSPATTSATTYKTQGATSETLVCQENSSLNKGTSFIILLEVAA